MSKENRKINNQVLKIKPYQLSRLVKILITNEHPIFRHGLEGLPIQVAKKRDGILLITTRRRHLEENGVEVAYVHNRRLPLV